MRRSHLVASALTLATAVASVTTPAALRAQTINFSAYACSDPSQPCEYQATTGRPLTSNGFDFYDRSDAFGGGGTNSLGTWSNNPSNLGFANRPSNVGAATTIFAPNNGDAIEMYASSGQNFSLYSMDVAGLFRQSSITPPLGAPSNLNILYAYFTSRASYLAQQADGSFYASIDRAPLVDGDRVPLLRTVNFEGTNADGVSVHWLNGSPTDLRGTGIYGVEWFQASVAFDSTGAGTLQARSGLAHQFTNINAEVVPEPGTLALAASGLLVVVGVGRRRRAV